MRKIIQFGDTIGDLFVFTPFEEEEDWGDQIDANLIETPFMDGAFSATGYDEPRKAPKTVTKRFTLYSKELLDEFKNAGKVGVCSHSFCDNESAYMRDLMDYMYRTVRGGWKRLYIVTEDGEIRWSWAKAIQIPYQKVFATAGKWQPFFIDFILADPYWYEVKDASTFIYQSVPIIDLVCNCSNMTEAQNIKPDEIVNFRDGVSKNMTTCFSNVCGYAGVIVRNEDVCALETDEECIPNGCYIDPTFWGDLGEGFVVNGDTTIEACVKGSAGAKRPLISFRGPFTNPAVVNQNNSNSVSYNGIILAGQYIEIDLGSAVTGEVDDMTINTNIPGFTATDITINNDGFFDLTKGINTLVVTGGTGANSAFTIQIINKYHN